MSNMNVLALDVRSDESVKAGVDAVLARAGRLDISVNNAGYELGGAIEEVSLEEAHSQFEANFFGVMSMVKAVFIWTARPTIAQRDGFSCRERESPWN
jgi:NAD(P)-dependent dehydrogenase (short-subunit alcohol dehydrogenase family)